MPCKTNVLHFSIENCRSMLYKSSIFAVLVCLLFIRASYFINRSYRCNKMKPKLITLPKKKIRALQLKTTRFFDAVW